MEKLTSEEKEILLSALADANEKYERAADICKHQSAEQYWLHKAGIATRLYLKFKENA